jgi:hypothetical protein
MKWWGLCFFLVPSLVPANDFICTIKAVTSIGESGVWEPDGDSFTLGKVGNVFTVDSNTGLVVGDAMLKNGGSGRTTITRKGEGNSFISLSQYNSGDVSLLKILSYKKIKSFYYIDTMVGQATGICKHI